MQELNSETITRLASWVRDFKTLTTPRIIARPFTVTDIDAHYNVMRNDRANRWIGGFEQPFDRTAARRWLVTRLERMERGEGVYGAVQYRDSGTMMGFFYAVIDPENGGVEIAGGLNEIYWGKGFVEEFSFALIAELFDAGAPSVLATCAFDNWSSMRVLGALNFTEIGVKTLQAAAGERRSRLFRLTPERWRSVRLLPVGDGLSPEDIRARRTALYAWRREM